MIMEKLHDHLPSCLIWFLNRLLDHPLFPGFSFQAAIGSFHPLENGLCSRCDKNRSPCKWSGASESLPSPAWVQSHYAMDCGTRAQHSLQYSSRSGNVPGVVISSYRSGLILKIAHGSFSPSWASSHLGILSSLAFLQNDALMNMGNVYYQNLSYSIWSSFFFDSFYI